ncbi:sarcosine oxidase subunit gamma [Streptomyces sp. NPDC054887]
MAELPYLAQINLRLDPKGPAADSIGDLLGAPLPVKPDTVVRTGTLVILWLGPDEWLVVGPPDARDALREKLADALGPEHGSVVDVSAQRTTLLVGGPRARDLLAHGCRIDLHPGAFGPGQCAQTTLARTQVILVPRDGTRPGYWVLVRSSFAAYLAEWLMDAASELIVREA